MTDDLISRQAAIDAIADYLSKTTYTSAISFLNTGALILARVPTAEPRKGKWIKDRLSSTCGGSYGVYRCSECESSYQDIGYGWNYCPNCGARMEESE